MTKDQVGEKNQNLEIDKGFELMLRNASRKKQNQNTNLKTFGIKINNAIKMFKWEVSFDFDLSLNIKRF